MKIFRQRNLPHIYPPGAVYFITFRLTDSLPLRVISKLREEIKSEKKLIKAINPVLKNNIENKLKKQIFYKYDNQLDQNKYGECFLKNKEIAKIVHDKIRSYDGEYYNLLCFSIMPNHVHILVDTRIQLSEKGLADENYSQVDHWMKLIKGGSAFLINKSIGRKGTLWSKESFDHFVRDEHDYGNSFYYILNNPIKAGLSNKYLNAPYMFDYRSEIKV